MATASPDDRKDAHDRAVLAQVRASTAKYHDLDAAVSDGYRLSSPCVPHMGYHYQRGVAATAGDLDASSPEILVYAPRADGTLRLVAVEYATWDASATLLGRGFDAPHSGGPPFHTLHAWVWQGNPDGMFEPVNPNVRCD
ncbi:hypothetical protein [Ornithinimicrobium sediminis]|uniref:hypothetical protein n=1 Tax=Ornithinimicrobium sediminis TaxID=2904603 RepID=UPI001E34B682|nr:hypothetical protein [Ornithinimicrobium sediminis]MCE0486939.1 hypothetical protein [Ornithinimicrobium sediminis]